MGCWNSTCGYSNLPIRAGEKVVCFIVTEQDFLMNDYINSTMPEVSPEVQKQLEEQRADNEISKFCVQHDTYAHSFRKPISLPFVGKYNDYGAVEDIEPSIHTKYLLDRFNKSLMSGSLKFRKMYFEGEKFETLEEVVDLVERGCWEQKSGFIDKYTLYMVHYDLYKNLVEIPSDPNIRRFARVDVLENISKDSLFEIWKKMHADGDAELDPAPMPSEEDLKFYKDHQYSSDYPHLGWLITSEMRMRYLEVREIDQWFEDLLHFYYFHDLLSATRKSYYMGSGGGSQHDGYEVYQKAYKKILRFNGKKVRKQKMQELDSKLWSIKYRIKCLFKKK